MHTLVSDGFTVTNCPVCCGGMHKNVQNTDFDPKIESIGFPWKTLVVLCLYDICNEKNRLMHKSVDINFKKLNFKNLSKIVLVSTMFIKSAENLAKLIGMRIILTSANWEYNVQ